MTAFAESVVEDAALAWLGALGYWILHGPDISPIRDALTPALFPREREKYSDVVLERRLRQSLARLNPDLLLMAARTRGYLPRSEEGAVPRA